MWQMTEVNKYYKYAFIEDIVCSDINMVFIFLYHNDARSDVYRGLSTYRDGRPSVLDYWWLEATNYWKPHPCSENFILDTLNYGEYND